MGGDGVLAGNTYAYNDRGQLLDAEGHSGTSAYAYDADGKMTSRADAAGTTAFTYDLAGRLETTTDPLTGTQVRSDFDAAGRPTVEEYARPARRRHVHDRREALVHVRRFGPSVQGRCDAHGGWHRGPGHHL